MPSQHSLRRKLVIVGDGACGKTSLLRTFVYGEFPKERQPIVFENYCAEIQLDGKTVQLALWDTAGQEEFERLRPLTYSESHVILIAFAIDTPDSLENVTALWIEEVRSTCGPIVPVFLVGCKADLRPPSDDPNIDRYVSREQAERVAQSICARAYKECSALKMEGVADVFEDATRAGILMREGVSVGTHARQKSSGSGDCNAIHGGRCCIIC